MSSWHRVTIEEIIDLEGGHEPVKSVDYLERLRNIPHEEQRLRIQLEKVRDLPDDEHLIICAWCYFPVMLRGNGYDKGTRAAKRLHFTHGRPNANCPYQNKDVVSQAEINLRKYHGLREGPRHQQMKERFAQCLLLQKNKEGNIGHIAVEKVIRSDVNSWRKPDINFQYNDHSIASEIQLSTTYLDVINGRHAFYRDAGIYMLWLFDSLTLKDDDRQFAKNDVIFNNRANAYVFDNDAYIRSVKNEKVFLRCYYVEYSYNFSRRKIEFSWRTAWVSLGDLKFDEGRFGLYYFDSDATLLQARAIEAKNHNFDGLMKTRVAFTKHLDETYGWERQETSVSVKNLNLEISEQRRSLGRWWRMYKDKRASIQELAVSAGNAGDERTIQDPSVLFYIRSKQELDSEEAMKISQTDVEKLEKRMEKFLVYANEVRHDKGVSFSGSPALIDITALFPRDFYVKFIDALYGKARLGPLAIRYPSVKTLEDDIRDRGQTTQIYMQKAELLAALEHRIFDFKVEIAQGTEKLDTLIDHHKDLMIEKLRRDKNDIADDFGAARQELRIVISRLRKANADLMFFDKQLANTRRNLLQWKLKFDWA